MSRMDRSTIVAVIAVVSLALFPAVIYSVEDGGHHDTGPNPLIDEMITLDKTFQEVVSAVSLCDGQRVHKALESMHGKMEKTHEGVHSGTVKIPKNAHRAEEFVKLDKAFHQDLEMLAHSAHENDWKGMLSLTKTLLDRCVECHRTFRK